MIQVRKEQSWLITVSLAIVAVVAVAVVLIYTRAIMIPFVVALFIVALVSPIQDFQIKRLRLPRIIAVVVTLFVVLFVISLVFLLIAEATTTIVSTAGEYSARFADLANRALESIEFVYREETPPAPASATPNDVAGAPPPAKPVPTPSGPLELYPVIESPEEAPVLVAEPQEAAASDPNAAGTPGKPLEATHRLPTKQIVRDLRNFIFNIVSNAFGTIFGLVSGVFLVSIFVMFMLAGRNPRAAHSEVYKDVVQKIRRYVGIKVATSSVTGILVWVTLNAIGLELAEVFGILAFLLNFIPSIGSIVATLLPIPIAVAQFQSPLPIILVVAIPGGIQGLIGNIIEPKLMGEGLNLHPVTILLALSFWGLLWGVVGMFLAAPITAAIRIVLMQFDMLQPIGNLLAGDFTKPSGLPPALSRPAEPTVENPPAESQAVPSSTPPKAVESAGSPPE
jgi:AI-2 transport protein TqsA